MAEEIEFYKPFDHYEATAEGPLEAIFLLGRAADGDQTGDIVLMANYGADPVYFGREPRSLKITQAILRMRREQKEQAERMI